jgi:hypothetical protein
MKKFIASFLMTLLVAGSSFAGQSHIKSGDVHGRPFSGIRSVTGFPHPGVNRFEQRRLMRATRIARRDGRITRKEAIILHGMHDRAASGRFYRGNRFCR